jgi:multiple sugar transport system permease protein
VRTMAAHVLRNGVLVLIGLAFFTPFVWLVAASFDAHASWGVRFPDFTLQNYRDVLTRLGFVALENSCYLAAATSLISTTFGFLAAYALSRHYVPLKRALMLAILFATGLPVSLLLVPTYQLYVFLGWLDSRFTTSLFLAAGALPFAVWMLKNFIDAIPVELEEAAVVEGAGVVQTLLRVTLPLALSGLAVTVIYTFISAWGAFIAPLILDGNPDHEPAPIAIFHFMGNHGEFLFGDLAAYSLLFSIPVILLYLSLSRQFSGAFTFGGSLKG